MNKKFDMFKDFKIDNMLGKILLSFYNSTLQIETDKGIYIYIYTYRDSYIDIDMDRYIDRKSNNRLGTIEYINIKKYF